MLKPAGVAYSQREKPIKPVLCVTMPACQKVRRPNISYGLITL